MLLLKLCTCCGLPSFICFIYDLKSIFSKYLSAIIIYLVGLILQLLKVMSGFHTYEK